MAIEVGKTARVKGGTIVMAIESVDNDSATCIWQDASGKLVRETFMLATLEETGPRSMGTKGGTFGRKR